MVWGNPAPEFFGSLVGKLNQYATSQGAAEGILSALGHVSGCMWGVAGFVHDLLANVVAPTKALEASLLSMLGVSLPDSWQLWVSLMLVLFAALWMTPDFFVTFGFSEYIVYDKYLFACGIVPVALIVLGAAFRVAVTVICGHEPPEMASMWNAWGYVVLVATFISALFAFFDVFEPRSKEEVNETIRDARISAYKAYIMGAGPLILALIFDSILAGVVMWVIAFALTRFSVVVGKRPGVIILHPMYFFNGKYYPKHPKQEIRTGVNVGGYIFPVMIGLYGLYELKPFLANFNVAVMFTLCTLSIFIATLISAEVKARRGVRIDTYFIPAFAGLYGFQFVVAISNLKLLPADSLSGFSEGFHYAAVATFTMLSISYAIAGDVLQSIRAFFRKIDLSECVYGGAAERDGLFEGPMLGVAIGPAMLWGLFVALLPVTLAWATRPDAMGVAMLAEILYLPIWPIAFPLLCIGGFFPGIVPGGASSTMPDTVEMFTFAMILLAGLAIIPALWYRIIRPFVVTALYGLVPCALIFAGAYAVGSILHIGALPFAIVVLVLAMPVVAALLIVMDRRDCQEFREKYGWDRESYLY